MEDRDPSTLPEGTRLAHYALRGPLGEGGMGRVYEAWDTALDRTVAVKVLRSEIADREGVVTRFQREARAAARVNHENLTHIYFVGEADGKHFIAMEHLPGRNLHAHVEAEGPLDLETAIDVLLQAARGLRAAHAGEVIHRDVKPSNLQLLPDGRVKVTDFGLAKSLSGDADVTGAGAILGTPRFMSPEQCRGETVDWRTDLYALGLVGWFLLTGKPPFDSDAVGKLLDEQMNSPLPPLAEARPGLSPGIHRVLERFCAKDPESRPDSMDEAIALLEEARPKILDLAPIGTRGAGLVIDVVFATVIVLATVGIVTLLRPGVSPESPHDWWTHAVCFALVVLLMTAWERGGGTSLGKLLFNLRVVTVGGHRPGTGRVLARLLIRFPAVSVFLLPAGSPLGRVLELVQLAAFLAAGFCYVKYRRRTLSDLLTRTRVIYRTSSRRREKTIAD